MWADQWDGQDVNRRFSGWNSTIAVHPQSGTDNHRDQSVYYVVADK
jgi:hypothetical protein